MLYGGRQLHLLWLPLADHPNPAEDRDRQLFRKLGLNPQQTQVVYGDNQQQQQLAEQVLQADSDLFYNAAR